MNFTLISTIIRGLQLFFAVLVLALTAAILGKIHGNSTSASFNLAVSLLTLIYLGYLTFLHVKQANTVIALPILVVEAILAVLWLASFATIANVAGALSCSYSYYGYYYTYSSGTSSVCQLAKATIAFSLFDWLLFTASLILFIIYTYVPLTKVHNFDYTTKTPTVLQSGAIFPAGMIHDEEMHGDVNHDAGHDSENPNNDKLEPSDHEHENGEDVEYKPEPPVTAHAAGISPSN